MTTLSELRKNKSALMDKVNKALAGQDNSEKKDDDRFWKPTRDAAGNGTAIIRFLPPVGDDELPWVKIFSRSFKSEAGKWYINDDLSTIGQTDPVYEYIKPLYESGLEEDKKKASPMKRKTSYISNVYIVKDPGNPANEGKVKLFKYGKKIHEMILGKQNPSFEDEKPLYVYDIDEGANFRLRIKQVEGYPNYDSSVFDSSAALAGGDDDEIEKIIKQYIPLAPFLDPKEFKSYDQLKKELERALGLGPAIGKASDLVGGAEKPKLSESKDVSIPEKTQKASKPVKEEKKVENGSPFKDDVQPSGDDDDDMALFKSMLGK